MAPRGNLNLEHQTHQNDDLDVVREESKADKNAINTGAVQGRDEDEDGESVIPFRTSKRLQGVFYRIIQQREGRYNSNNVPTKDRHSSAKKQEHVHSSPERSDVAKKAIRKDCEDEDSTPPNVSNAGREIGTCGRKRKRKNCTVHFADPLVTYIKDKKEAAAAPTASGKQHPIPSKFDFLQSRKAHHHAEHAAVVQPKRSLTDDNHHQQQRKHRPLSCFDLLCNHVGPRGWRCYRTSMEGKYFCSYHQNRKAISFEKGISQTVCT